MVQQVGFSRHWCGEKQLVPDDPPCPAKFRREKPYGGSFEVDTNGNFVRDLELNYFLCSAFQQCQRCEARTKRQRAAAVDYVRSAAYQQDIVVGEGNLLLKGRDWDDAHNSFGHGGHLLAQIERGEPCHECVGRAVHLEGTGRGHIRRVLAGSAILPPSGGRVEISFGPSALTGAAG